MFDISTAECRYVKIYKPYQNREIIVVMKNRSIWLPMIIQLVVVTITGAVLGYLIGATSPKQLGPVGVTIWFLFFFVFAASLISMIFYIWRMRKQTWREKHNQCLKDGLRVGLLSSLCLTLLIGLMSLKSLTIRDMILFILTVVIIELYFRTRSKTEQ